VTPIAEQNTGNFSNGHANGSSNGHFAAIQSPRTQEDTFNVRELLLKLLKFWYLFVISIGISFTIAYFYNRYSTPRYYTSATLLIKDRRNSVPAGADAFLEGMNLVNIQRNIENEITIIRSHSMAIATVRQLDFGVSFYTEGNVRTSEVYAGDMNFKVITDSSHVQLLNTLYSIEFIDNKSFRLKADTKGSYVFDIASQKPVTPKSPIIFREGIYNFDNFIEGEYYKFKVVKRPDMENISGSYTFKFHSTGELAAGYAGAVQVRTLGKNSSIVDLSLETTNPSKGIAFLNKLCQVYVENSLQEKNQIADNTIRFVDSYLNAISDSLFIAEDKLQRFRTDNKFFDLSSEAGMMAINLDKLKNERDLQNDQLKYYAYLQEYIDKKNDFSDVITPSVAKVDDPSLVSLITEMGTLYVQRNSIKLYATNDNPIMIEHDKKIQSRINTMKEILTNAIKSTNLLKTELTKRITLAEQGLSHLPITERNLLSIKRKFSLNEDSYIYLLKKRAEAGIAKAANVPDHKIIDAASGAVQIYPQSQYNYSVAIIIGLFIPIVLILVRDYFNDTIANRKQLESLTSIPILGIIGHNEKPSRLVVTPNSKSVISEAFRSLRSNLQYVVRNKERKTILVTSTVSGEGKTFCTNNMAYVLALSGKKVLLMEVDLRKPLPEDDFGISSELGLTHYLIGKATKQQIIKKSQYEFLDVIQSGELPPNPAEILMDEKMAFLMKELQQEYDYILIDTSPIGLVSDAFELIKFSDLVLFVVRQGYTKRDYVTKLDEIYRIEANKSFNIVLNDAKVQNGYGYYNYGSYGYGYYGSYYGYVEEEPAPKNLFQQLLSKKSKSSK
jgi:capsular exopolysaccharide synthesis family protein